MHFCVCCVWGFFAFASSLTALQYEEHLVEQHKDRLPKGEEFQDSAPILIVRKGSWCFSDFCEMLGCPSLADERAKNMHDADAERVKLLKCKETFVNCFSEHPKVRNVSCFCSLLFEKPFQKYLKLVDIFFRKFCSKVCVAC